MSITDEQIEALLAQIPESDDAIAHSRMMGTGVGAQKLLVADREGLVHIVRICLEAALLPAQLHEKKSISCSNRLQQKLEDASDVTLVAVGRLESWPETPTEPGTATRTPILVSLGCVLIPALLIALLISGVAFWIQLFTQGWLSGS